MIMMADLEHAIAAVCRDQAAPQRQGRGDGAAHRRAARRRLQLHAPGLKRRRSPRHGDAVLRAGDSRDHPHGADGESRHPHHHDGHQPARLRRIPISTSARRKVYDKICRARRAGSCAVGDEIERDYGIPIINKRISVTPIALVAESIRGRRLRGVRARARSRRAPRSASTSSAASRRSCTRARRAATEALLASIPEALATTERVCASVNVGTTTGRHQHGRRRAPGRDHPRHRGDAPPTATASAAPSSSCSATRWTTTRSWPARSTASASPSA